MSDRSQIKKYKRYYNSIDSGNSEDENLTDSYKNALISNLTSIYDNPKRKKSSEGSDLKPTESRIEFVKNILSSVSLKPMIKLENCDTEKASEIRLGKTIIDAKELFTSMNVTLRYLKSGTTGHTFKAVSTLNKDIAFAVKVCAYPKDDYGGIYNLSRPENAEIIMLKLLGPLVIKQCTPHLVLPIYTFNTSITNFVNIPPSVINLQDREKNSSYRKFLERYKDKEFEDFVSVLISEWCSGGDLSEYLKKNYRTMSLKHWTVIIFQILFTLAKIHSVHKAFRHNDMKANNILVHQTEVNGTNYGYDLGDIKFIIPNINLQIKIWDFDFACIEGVVENNKVNSDWTKKMNISKRENKYYDMHYFLNTLSRFFPQLYTSNRIPREVIEFIYRVIPEKYRSIPEEYRSVLDKYYNLVKHFKFPPKKHQYLLKQYDMLSKEQKIIVDNYCSLIEKNGYIPEKYGYVCEKYHALPEQYQVVTDRYVQLYEEYCEIPQKYKDYYKYVNTRGRIMVNIEYTTPYKVIMEDPLFKDYRFPKSMAKV